MTDAEVPRQPNIFALWREVDDTRIRTRLGGFFYLLAWLLTWAFSNAPDERLLGGVLGCALFGALLAARLLHRPDGLDSPEQLQRWLDRHWGLILLTALCWGQPEQDSGSIDLPLRYDPPTKPRHVVDHELGKHALTHWRIVERCGDWCRVELTPITGRSHQLRVHMLSIGHPLLGDRLYAHEQALAAHERLCLHASMLALTHPQTGERLRFECPAPF